MRAQDVCILFLEILEFTAKTTVLVVQRRCECTLGRSAGIYVFMVVDVIVETTVREHSDLFNSIVARSLVYDSMLNVVAFYSYAC